MAKLSCPNKYIWDSEQGTLLVFFYLSKPKQLFFYNQNELIWRACVSCTFNL